MTERDFDADCPLCEAARITPWFHDDDICWIAHCDICLTPMVVWRGHGIEPPEDERGHMLAQLTRVAHAEVGPHWFDGDMRNIPDHFHLHARPEGGFFGPGGGPHRLLMSAADRAETHKGAGRAGDR